MDNQQKNQRSRFNSSAYAASGSGKAPERGVPAGDVRRPSGFQAQRRPAPQPKQENRENSAPAARKKPETEKVKRRRKGVGKKIVIAALIAVLLAAIITGVVLLIAASANKTVHMLPEIRDIEQAESRHFAAESPLADVLPESLDSFMAEGAGA